MQLLGLYLVHHQHVDVGQDRLNGPYIKGRGGIDHKQSLFPPNTGGIRLGRGFILQQQNIANLGKTQSGFGISAGQPAVGTGDNYDAVFGVRINANYRMARRFCQFHNIRSIDPKTTQSSAGPFTTCSNGASVKHLGASPRSSNRLIGALASQSCSIGFRSDRFPRRGQMRHFIEVVDIDRAEVKNRH